MSRTRHLAPATLVAALCALVSLLPTAPASAKVLHPVKTTAKLDYYRVGIPARIAGIRLVGYPHRRIAPAAIRRHTRHGLLWVSRKGAARHRGLRVLRVAHAASSPETVITSGPDDGQVTSSTTATFAFASDTGVRFRCSLDRHRWRKCSSPRTYSGLAHGSHNFRVAAIDRLGNVDATPASRTWTIGTAPPTTTTSSTPPPSGTTTTGTTGTTTTPGTTASGCAPAYSGTSPWNTPIPANPTYDPASAQMVATMNPSANKLTSDPTQYTFPVYYVNNSTPLSKVSYTGWYSDVSNGGATLTNHRPADLSQRYTQLPVPSSAIAAAGTDAQVVIVNTDTGEEWDASHFVRDSTGLTAWNIGHYNVGWSGVPPYDAGGNPYWLRGPGIPYLTGLMRPCEIAQGHIDHALAFAYPSTTPQFRYPGTRSDGQSSSGMPEGTHLQLDPTVSDSTIQNTWGCKGACFTIAKALQRYGMFIADTGGRPKIMPEYDGTAHWNGAISASTPSPIPLSAFKVLPPPAH